tara:strand:- start:11144 stop:11392 length:249 start_codon:yes stop_codon:yes gene_type:complete
MKKILAFTLLVLFTNISYSEEEKPTLEDAPKSYLLNLLAECKEYATQEEVTGQNLNTYLLQCINEELEASYYKPIKTLPAEE